MVRIKFQKLNPEAVEPTKAHHNDAGFDMVATSRKKTGKYVQYGTGIAMEIPDGYVGLIYPRSSVTKKDLMLKNSVGVIDAGYRGEISFRFMVVDGEQYLNADGVYYKNFDNYEVGDRIGQIIIQKIPDVVLLEVDELEDSERGTGGYGSTDNKQ